MRSSGRTQLASSAEDEMMATPSRGGKRVLATERVDYGGNPVTENATVALDYVGGANAIYQGTALPGTAKTAALWQIRKFTYDASANVTDIQWANGDTGYTNIWNNRATLSYS